MQISNTNCKCKFKLTNPISSHKINEKAKIISYQKITEKEIFMHLTIGFLGLGLIGGSIAKSIRKYHPDYTLIGYNHNYETALLAQREQILDLAVKEVDSSFSNCDIIYLCMPVSFNEEYLSQVKPYLKKGCILTDVGSVKGNIHQAVKKLSLEEYFIGGHPMAGSEKTGFSNSTDHLLENAYYILTPCKCTSKDAIDRLYHLTASIKAIPIVLDPKEHDYAVANISHLPHLIAAGLVNLIQKSDSDTETMKTLAAGGFKDITRIASSSPVMWQQICLTNKENIVQTIEHYLSYLSEIRDAVKQEDGDYLYQFFEQARIYRNSIPAKSSGPITTIYAMYCDLIDEAGSLAKVVVVLAEHGISIKNIGITHTRDFQEETLRIEFYEQNAMLLAQKLLEQLHYSVTICS